MLSFDCMKITFVPTLLWIFSVFFSSHAPKLKPFSKCTNIKYISPVPSVITHDTHLNVKQSFFLSLFFVLVVDVSFSFGFVWKVHYRLAIHTSRERVHRPKYCLLEQKKCHEEIRLWTKMFCLLCGCTRTYAAKFHAEWNNYIAVY